MIGDQFFEGVSNYAAWAKNKLGDVTHKLDPRYIDLFCITKIIGDIVCKLDLFASMSWVHNVFHVFILRKYIMNLFHLLKKEPIELNWGRRYVERPIEILVRDVKQLQNENISLVKVLRRSQSTEEATWERKHKMIVKYLELFGK